MFAGRMLRVMLGIAGAVAFAALLALEVVTSDSPITIAELILESVEILLTVTVATGVILIISQIQKQQEEKIELIRELDLAHAEGEAWRDEAQRHISGLSVAIQTQFRDWGLSPAESQVAMLMLKGLTHKEIAMLRETNEATVRQQARSIYARSNLNSRQAYCAFFLEDLLPPMAAT